MRILFVSHYFPPEVNAPANRTHEHAREWVRAGHEVIVVTGVPNHPHGRLFPGYRNRWLQEETIDGIRVVRTWMYLTANSGFARRTANYVLFMLTAVLAGLRLPRPDVVVSTTPQFFCGVAGLVLSKLRRRPFVLELRDLWPDSIVQLGQVRSPLAIRMLEAVEARLYRSADGIVVVARSFRSHVMERGVPPERVELVYNGIDLETFRPRHDAPSLGARGIHAPYSVGYVGTIGLAHGLRTLLDAAERLPDVAFLLIGDGADRDALEADARRRGLANVNFTGLVPRAEIPEWLSAIDVLLVMLRDLPVFETVIPSKTFEYLAQERPVILAAPRRGEIRAMVEAAGVAYTVEPEDPDALAAQIQHLREHPDEAAERARKARHWVEAGFRREELAARMLAFLERTAAAGRGARS